MSTSTNPDRRNVLLAGTTLAIASAFAAATTQVASAETSSLNPQSVPPSPNWRRAMPPAPDARIKLDDAALADRLPAGSTGTAAIFTDRGGLRQIAITNDINPF